MFSFFKTKEDKVIKLLQDLCELCKNDDQVKNVIKYFYMILSKHKKNFDEKQFRNTDFKLFKEHWLALNIQLFIGSLAKTGDFNLYNDVRKKFGLDDNKKKVALFINSYYAPIYANINSESAWGLLAEELLFQCFYIEKEIGLSDAFNEYHLEINNFIFEQHLNFKKYFDEL